MPSLATPFLLCLHLLAAALWVGGMATFHFAVRPAAVETLEPPQRLRMLCGALGRFFRWVTAAIVLLLATGFSMVALAGGMGAVHWHVHAMLGIAVVMMVIFAVIRRRHHAQMAEKVTAGDWKAAGAALGRIRQLVFINLWLGVAVFVIAVVGRSL
ncbi:MAG: CopD family protein [Proteobacteria bacterium]|nr:CopD family protein [Pseudomonadota bacterium]